MRKLDLSEGIYLGLLGLVAAFGWAATLLAQLGRFSLPAILLLGLAFALPLLPLNAQWQVRDLPRADLLMLVILAMLAVLLAEPFEWVLGGRDPGYYFHFGVILARQGSLIWEDHFARTVLPDLWPIFYSWLDGAHTYERFRGVPFLDPASGLTGPFFFPLFSASMGTGYALAGVGGALRAPSVYILLGCAGVYMAGRTIFNPRTGLIAAGLLALTPAELWFGRFPMSESAQQCWFWGGLAALALYLETGNQRAGLLSGACWGLAALTHFEMLLAAPLVFAGLVATVYLSRRPVWPVATLAIPLFLQALIYALTAGRVYTAYIIYGISVVVRGVLLLAPVAFLFALALPAARPLIRHYERQLRLALLIILVLSIAVFILARRETLVALSWYVPVPALALAAGGVLLYVWRWPFGLAWFWFALAVPLFAQLAAYPAVSPDYHWAIRRWLPVAIPSLWLCAGYALIALARLPRPRLTTAFQLVLLLVSLAALLAADRPILFHQEYPGAEAQIAELAQHFEPNSVILLWPAATTEALALPLYVQHGREVFVVQQVAEADRFWEQVDRWRAAGYRVYTGHQEGQPFPFTSARYRALPAFTWQLHTSQLEYPTDHYPEQPIEIVLPVSFDELVPASQ